MHIQSANLALTANTHAESSTRTRESFQLSFRQPGAVPERRSLTVEQEPQEDLSRAGALLRLERQTLDLSGSLLSADDHFLIQLIQELFYRMTGRQMALQAPPQISAPLTLDIPISVAPAADVGMVYERTVTYRESQSLDFRASGQVTTADGRQIDIATALHMSHTYAETSTFSVRQGSAALIDPLVINFDGRGARLENTPFEFDLDNDGVAEQLASLVSGSGYLALDRNGDGEINNGSELFGPDTGKGFTELAQFDDDGNGFIDEVDAIYDKLRIWRRHGDGTNQLIALGEAGVGAIYLGHVTSPFSLKDESNQLMGQIASSGIYLREDGSSGMVQQVDLAV